MVHGRIRPAARDASPFLGMSEHVLGQPESDSDTDGGRGGGTAEQQARRYYSRAPVPPVPTAKGEHYKSPRRGGATTMHLRVRVVAGSSGGGGDGCGAEEEGGRGPLHEAPVFSPLVVSRASWKRGSSATARSGAGALHISLPVTEATTVEDLAMAIENAHNLDPSAEGGPLVCAALFRDRAPLLFTQCVRAVLQSGDTVLAYTSTGWSDDDDEGRDSDSDSNDVVIDYAQNTGGSSNSNNSNGGCVFVPLTEATGGKRSSVVSVGNVDMGRVERLIARAPLKARFINVLVRPALLRAFMGFCALPSELALESLLFVLDVERFRHVQPSMARLLANYIYLSYIAPQAPLRINTSSMMRERIPWPFLPGWEYSPWVFDEVLASVGFTLKKHTLLRFERSPVGLRALMDSPGFSADHYVAPLRFDGDTDPMAAIADNFEPDIDVVIWVNELQADTAQMTAALSRLTVAFREQLLQRVAAQFVDERHALCLCDGYFRLASHIAPLQKQRKIKKTRKLRSFFGDNPHEALLRQQLMAVVPPSSHVPAARAAAELVARKRTAEARICGADAAAAAAAAAASSSRDGSVGSSILAEQRLLAMDSDGASDCENERMRGWAHEAMRRPSASEVRARSWSDSSSDDNNSNNRGNSGGARVNSNGWTTDEDADADRPLTARRGHRVYSDQALSRALSMIGMAHPDSQDSASSDSHGGASSDDGDDYDYDYDDGPDLRRRATTAAAAMRQHQQLPGYSVYSLSSLGRPRPSRFERKKRADKLREFFGRMDPGAGVVPAAPPDADGRASSSSVASASLRGSSSLALSDAPPAHLTPEQRHILVRRRRKLKALLGEQVEECVVSLAPPARPPIQGRSRSPPPHPPSAGVVLSALDESACSLLTPEHTSQASSGAMSSTQDPAASDDDEDNNDDDDNGDQAQQRQSRDMRDAQIRQYCKIRSVLGETAPAPCLYDRPPSHEHAGSSGGGSSSISNDDCYDDGALGEQRVRARWRRNKLVTMLGDVPTDISTVYKSDIAAAADRAGSGSGPACATGKQDRRQRVKKLRHFFGQSLSSEAMLAQGATPVRAPESPGATDSSYEFVAAAAESARFMPPDLVPADHAPVRAQFWMTGSPESQESVVTDEATSHRSSLLATLRAHKATIIGTIRRAPPRPQAARDRTSTQSSQASSSAASLKNRLSTLSAAAKPADPAAPPSPAPGKLGLLARKIIRSDAEPPLVPPARSTSIQPLLLLPPSPLPPISPNNLQASFDRSAALAATAAPALADERLQRLAYPPRVSSAERKPPHEHRDLVASALLSTPTAGTRSKPRPARSGSKGAGTKSVHWFDSPRPGPSPQEEEEPLPPPPPPVPPEQQRTPEKVEEEPLGQMSLTAQLLMDPPPAPPHSQPASAKSSMELAMAIVLRSPSTKKATIVRSPTASPRTLARSPPPLRSRFPTLPIGSPPPGPRMLLSHKASISAVGGRQLRCSAEHARPSLEGIELASLEAIELASRASADIDRNSTIIILDSSSSSSSSGDPSGSGSGSGNSSSRSSVVNGWSNSDRCSGFVTIRARRSRSFAIHRKLERATAGRKRSHTIGTGRQAETHVTALPGRDADDGIPRADRNTRRVQSMILPAQYPPEARLQRSRCVTVIPLHLELQRLLARRLAAAAERRASARRLRAPTLVTVDEVDETQPDATADTQRLRSLCAAASALCIHDPSAPSKPPAPPRPPAPLMRSAARSRAPLHSSPLRGAVLRRPASCQFATAGPAPSAAAGLRRTRSCAGRFVSVRRCSPIQPAIARYLQSANASTPLRRAPSTGYQRISMALLSRPPHLAGTTTRRSLDPRAVQRRKLSPYMESTLRRFASLEDGNLRGQAPKPRHQ